MTQPVFPTAPAAQPSATGLLDHPMHWRRAGVLLALLVALPFVAQASGQEFYIGVASRILIFALAAVSLNLILGFGGMVSFGHAAYLGMGAYTVGILMFHGVTSAWLAWPLAVLASGVFALAIGAISLRTKGVYFIMITLAFAQLVYYVGGGLEAYGADDGLNISRSRFPGLIDLRDKASFYWLCFVLLCGTLWFCSRFANSRFGHVIRGAKSNDLRMTAAARLIGAKVICTENLSIVLGNENLLIRPQPIGQRRPLPHIAIQSIGFPCTDHRFKD